METGDLFGPTCGYRACDRFLEPVLEREKTAVSISSLDAGDQKLHRIQEQIGMGDNSISPDLRLEKFAAYFRSQICLPTGTNCTPFDLQALRLSLAQKRAISAQNDTVFMQRTLGCNFRDGTLGLGASRFDFYFPLTTRDSKSIGGLDMMEL
jgi:hypothetical protein